jgi:ribosome modulation factor
MTADQAYRNGYDARTAAKPISCNPFNTLQSQHTDWDNGWLDRRDYEMIPAKRHAYGERHRLNTYR